MQGSLWGRVRAEGHLLVQGTLGTAGQGARDPQDLEGRHWRVLQVPPGDWAGRRQGRGSSQGPAGGRPRERGERASPALGGRLPRMMCRAEVSASFVPTVE